ncbi:MAG: hypothetical protein WCP55_09340 [Lentisphaerota bacterium]
MSDLSSQIPPASDMLEKLENARKMVLERAVELVVTSINTAVENRQTEVQVKMRLGEPEFKTLKSLFIEKGYRADYNGKQDLFIIGWGRIQ